MPDLRATSGAALVRPPATETAALAQWLQRTLDRIGAPEDHDTRLDEALPTILASALPDDARHQDVLVAALSTRAMQRSYDRIVRSQHDPVFRPDPIPSGWTDVLVRMGECPQGHMGYGAVAGLIVPDAPRSGAGVVLGTCTRIVLMGDDDDADAAGLAVARWLSAGHPVEPVREAVQSAWRRPPHLGALLQDAGVDILDAWVQDGVVDAATLRACGPRLVDRCVALMASGHEAGARWLARIGMSP